MVRLRGKYLIVYMSRHNHATAKGTVRVQCISCMVACCDWRASVWYCATSQLCTFTSSCSNRSTLQQFYRIEMNLTGDGRLDLLQDPRLYSTWSTQAVESRKLCNCGTSHCNLGPVPEQQDNTFHIPLIVCRLKLAFLIRLEQASLHFLDAILFIRESHMATVVSSEHETNPSCAQHTQLHCEHDHRGVNADPTSTPSTMPSPDPQVNRSVWWASCITFLMYCLRWLLNICTLDENCQNFTPSRTCFEFFGKAYPLQNFRLELNRWYRQWLGIASRTSQGREIVEVFLQPSLLLYSSGHLHCSSLRKLGCSCLRDAQRQHDRQDSARASLLKRSKWKQGIHDFRDVFVQEQPDLL